MKCHVVPDEASVKVPHLSYEDRHALNRLTAYGRPTLEGSSLRCGCFHCGSSFVAREITAWMPEEDGADTALCPYCGCDAVLYDTKEFPLSTALLSSMYMEWFKSEYQERETVATYAPLFSGYDDYQLFLINSGAEANENALKLASFHTGRSRVISFSKAFRLRSSGPSG